MRALQEGLRVISVEVPFSYPSIQKANENAEGEKNMKKRRENRWTFITELIHLVRLSQESPKGKPVRISELQ